MNKGCYIVKESNGDMEDYWERIIGVCPTLSLAESLKKKVEDLLSSKIIIPADKFEEMYNNYLKSQYYEDIDEAEGIHLLYPEYSLEDIENVLDLYLDGEYDKEITIRCYDFYETENDLNNVTEKY